MEKNSREGVAPTTSVPYGMAPRMDEKGNVVYKISKAPDLPNFSGTELVPRRNGHSNSGSSKSEVHKPNTLKM